MFDLIAGITKANQDQRGRMQGRTLLSIDIEPKNIKK